MVRSRGLQNRIHPASLSFPCSCHTHTIVETTLSKRYRNPPCYDQDEDYSLVDLQSTTFPNAMIPIAMNHSLARRGLQKRTSLVNVVCLTMIVLARRDAVQHAIVSAFAPNFPSHEGVRQSTTTELFEVIQGSEQQETVFDEGLGGVRLAKESAIKVTGYVKHSPGSAECFPTELLRYDTLKKVDESKVREILKTTGSTVLCSGQGVELYKDPGITTEAIVKYAPIEAVKDAFTNAASAIGCDRLVFNFLGGDDLMLGEVKEAANDLVLMLDIPTKAKISFNSLCHKTLPLGSCTVTVVSLGGADVEPSSWAGLEKSVASGEVYIRDGAWYTVEESDINTALA